MAGDSIAAHSLTALGGQIDSGRNAGGSTAIDAERDEQYWSGLRDVARQTDPELALAQHLASERQRRHRWYPIGEAWRNSQEYTRACAAFEENVVAALARELEGGSGHGPARPDDARRATRRDAL